MGVHITLDTLLFELLQEKDSLLFELLQAKNNTNDASKTSKPIVQYYYVVLCEFESQCK